MKNAGASPAPATPLTSPEKPSDRGTGDFSQPPAPWQPAGSARNAAGWMLGQREPLGVFPKCRRLLPWMPGGENASGHASVMAQPGGKQGFGMSHPQPLCNLSLDASPVHPAARGAAPGSPWGTAQCRAREERGAGLSTRVCPGTQHRAGRAGTEGPQPRCRDPRLTRRADPLRFTPMLRLWGARRPLRPQEPTPAPWQRSGCDPSLAGRAGPGVSPAQSPGSRCHHWHGGEGTLPTSDALPHG